MENESGVWWDTTNARGDSAAADEDFQGYGQGTENLVQCYYHQTHQQATRVLDCATGCFFGKEKGQFLVVSHGTSLVVYGNEPSPQAGGGSKKSRHQDPMQAEGGSAASPSAPSSFKALQRIPLNGTCLFLETISSRYKAPGSVPALGTSLGGPDKDYLFVYLMKERYLVMDLVETTTPEKSGAAGAPFQMDVRVIVTDSITNPFNVKSVYTLEQVAAQSNLQAVAIHVYHKVVTILNLKSVIEKYHEALKLEPEKWNSARGFAGPFLEGGHNTTFTLHQRIDEAFVHSIGLGLFVNAHDYQGQSTTAAAAAAGGGGSTASNAATAASARDMPMRPVSHQLRLFLVHDDRRSPQRRHVSYYPMDLHHPKLVQDDYWRSVQLHQDVDSTANLLYPVHNGVCVIGDTLMSFVNGVELPRTISLPTEVHSPPQCVAGIDEWRFLIAHGQNSVSIASVHPPASAQLATSGTGEVNRRGPGQPAPSSASAQMLDIRPIAHDVPSPHCLAYLAGGHCFSGSAYGDSVVIHLLPPADGTKSDTHSSGTGNMEVMIPGVGPVSSIISRKVDGRQFVVAGSGGKRDGGLCNLKLSVDFETMGELGEMDGLLHSWTCGPFIVLGFEQYNRLLSFNGSGELEEVAAEETGFQAQQRTLCCGAFTAQHGDEKNLLHVTEFGISVLDLQGRKTLATAEFTDGAPSHASLFAATEKDQSSFLLVAQGKRVLQYTLTSQQALSSPHLVAELESEVACLHCTKPGEVIVGLWQSNKVILITDASRGNGTTQETIFMAPSLPRSVLLLHLNATCGRALIVGLADGRMCFGREEDAKTLQKTGNRFPVTQVMDLGTQPVQLSILSRYSHEDGGGGVKQPAVVCCCDFPAVITMPKRSIQVSPIALESLNSCSNFSAELVASGGMPINSVVAATQDGSVVLGKFTSTTTLMKRRIVEQGSINYVTYHKQSKHLVASVFGPTKDEVALYSMPSMERQERTLVLSEHERVTALCATTLGGGEEPHMPFDAVVVSVTFMINEEREPQYSRLVVYNIENVVATAGGGNAGGATGGTALKMIGIEKEVHGGVFSLCPASYNRLIVGVNGQIDVYSWSHVESSLIVESSVKLNLVPVTLFQHSSGNLYVVGDCESSISLLSFNQADHIVVVGRDTARRPVMDVTMCGEEIAVSDTLGNLFFMNHSSARDAEGKKALQEQQENRQRRRAGAEWAEAEDGAIVGEDDMPMGMDDGEADDIPGGSAAQHEKSRSRNPGAKLLSYQKEAATIGSCWHQGDTINYLTTGFFSDAGACSKAFFHNTSLGYIFKSFSAPNVLYGTANGALGSFAPMRIQALSFLMQLVASVEDELNPIGGVGSAAFRRIECEGHAEAPLRSRGIVDGDVINLYFSFPNVEQQEQVVKNLIKRMVALPAIHRTADAAKDEDAKPQDATSPPKNKKKDGSAEPDAAQPAASNPNHLLILPNENVLIEMFKPYLSEEAGSELEALVLEGQNQQRGASTSTNEKSVAAMKAEILFTTRTIENLIDDLQRYY